MFTLAYLLESLLVWLNIQVHLKNCPHNNREKCEKQIKKSYRPWWPKRSPWSVVVETKCKLNNSEDHVFIKRVEDHLTDPHIVESSIVKQKFPQDAELSDCIIWNLSCSCPFFTEYTNPNMCLHYHVGIIGSISNR